MVDFPRRKAYWSLSHTPSADHAAAILSFRTARVSFFSTSCSFSGRCLSSASTPTSFGIMYVSSWHHEEHGMPEVADTLHRSEMSASVVSEQHFSSA